MNTEFEAMFTDVDHDDVRARLNSADATLVVPEFLMQRTIFDCQDLSLDQQAAWIRLRKEPDKITLTYKQRENETIEGMKEIEVTVDDYQNTRDLLLATGLTVKSEQESKREIWQLDHVEVVLDTWPWIPPVVEIEGQDEECVKNVSEKLGLAWDEATFDSIDAVYMQHFDVSRVEISSVPITFEEVPGWLEDKRKTTTAQTSPR